jgi:uncharacterized phiE125 gp8 family phage protein
MRSTTIITEPSREPVSVKEARDYARIDYTTDDVIIGVLIQAARKQIEDYTGLGLGYQKVKYTLPVSCYNESQLLPRRPFKEVVSISHQSCRLSPIRSVLTETDIWEIKGDSFSGEKGSYEVVYLAGYAYEDIPAGLKVAILDQVAYDYNNRGTNERGICMKAKDKAKAYKLNVWGL